MTSRWWYGVAGGGVAWVLLVLVPEFLWQTGLSTEAILDSPAAPAVVVVWIAIPLCTYLDWRAIRESVAWEPTLSAWGLLAVVPTANLAVAAAYSLRRASAVRGTAPGPQWRYAVAATAVCWPIGFGLDLPAVASALPSSLAEPHQPFIIAGWLGLPVAVYLDAEYVRGHADWDPTVPLWVIGVGVPFVNLPVVVAYAAVRYRVLKRTADDATSPATPASDPDGRTPVAGPAGDDGAARSGDHSWDDVG